MANLFNTAPNHQYQEPDEISQFLHQILLHSSSSSPPPLPSSTMHQHSLAPLPDLLPPPKQMHAQIPIPSDCNAPSNLENELDNYDCESEEAIEATVEETAAKPTPSRSCSKRSRAAEVHNLSEKRRRSRINEKMKALQNLIPNSNKTDKASMLDEAIEYLRQLQLQVQMLTMRNGLSLYPISLPGMLQPNQPSQIRTDINDPDKFVNVNMTKPICTDQNIPAPVTDFSRMVGSKSSFEVETSVRQHHFGGFQLSGSSKGICKEKVLPCRPLIEDHPRISSGAIAKAASSIPCGTQTTNLKANVCGSGGDHLLANFVNSTIFHPH